MIRGIESRRHDCPTFIKNFQNKLIQTLFDVETVEEVLDYGYNNAKNYVEKTIADLMNGAISIEELVVSKILRKSLSEYKNKLPHVSAAINLSQKGKEVKKGDMIDFVYINARHHNPLRRVAPIEIYDLDSYDRQKYRDMVLDAAETVLSTFGFSRQKYGLTPDIRSFHKRLFRELREESMLEEETEEFVYS